MAQERPDRALAELVARFGQANGETVLLRPEITASWRRCLIDGLTAERFTVPYRADIDAAGRLTWAAGPAFDRATDDLQGTPIALS